MLPFKILSLLATLFVSATASAAPQYTLDNICQTYGRLGRCSSVDFCKETVFQQGCYLAQGAPSYAEGLCRIQSSKWACDIMQQQGNCVWVEANTSTCRAKFESL